VGQPENGEATGKKPTGTEERKGKGNRNNVDIDKRATIKKRQN